MKKGLEHQFSNPKNPVSVSEKINLSLAVQLQRQNAYKKAIREQRQSLQQNLQAVQKLTPLLKEKGLDSIQRDRANQTQSLQVLQELLPTFKQRLNNCRQLLKEGAISGDTVLGTGDWGLGK